LLSGAIRGRAVRASWLLIKLRGVLDMQTLADVMGERQGGAAVLLLLLLLLQEELFRENETERCCWPVWFGSRVIAAERAVVGPVAAAE
jgi:hypothetical protein